MNATTNRANAYRIYIRSEEHPRTINTPQNGRVLYSVIEVYSKEDYLQTLIDLATKGEQITEVRYGWGCTMINHYADLYRLGIKA